MPHTKPSHPIISTSISPLSAPVPLVPLPLPFTHTHTHLSSLPLCCTDAQTFTGYARVSDNHTQHTSVPKAQEKARAQTVQAKAEALCDTQIDK